MNPSPKGKKIKSRLFIKKTKLFQKLRFANLLDNNSFKNVLKITTLE
jgi:hypothetical protein